MFPAHWCSHSAVARRSSVAEDLALAHAAVYIPTAAAANKPRTGAGGRFSLNLSHAAAILAYDLFQAVKRPALASGRAADLEGAKIQLLDTAVRDCDPFLELSLLSPWRLYVTITHARRLSCPSAALQGRAQLVQELAGAVRALTVYRDDEEDVRRDPSPRLSTPPFQSKTPGPGQLVLVGSGSCCRPSAHCLAAPRLSAAVSASAWKTTWTRRGSPGRSRLRRSSRRTFRRSSASRGG